MSIEQLKRILTPRERQVVASLCEGFCNKLIGRGLGISEGAVKVHLASIYSKLGVTGGRMALMALAIAYKDQLGV
jgi:DNA-binding NarL/FixJ family response regulator